MAPQSVLNPQVLKQIEHYVQILQSRQIAFERLIVFGSQAKGDAKPWSDIDLGIISTNFGHNRFDERVMLMQLKDEQSADIEPHPLHPDDFRDKYDTLSQEIKRYGISL